MATFWTLAQSDICSDSLEGGPAIRPFWTTYWFGVCFTLAVVLMVVLGFRLWTQAIRNQNKRFERMVRERTYELSNSKRKLESYAAKLKGVKALIQKQNAELKILNGNLEQKVLERTIELKRAVKDLDKYIDKTAHDLRGPISSLLGIHDIILSEVSDRKAIHYFNLYNEQIKQVDKIIIDLLKLSKFRDKKIDRKMVDVQAIVEASIKSFRHLPNYDKINFGVQVNGNAKLYTDPGLIECLIENLIENGINHARDDSEAYLLVNVEIEDAKLILTVTDNGIGIDKKYHKKIYDMFFRGDCKRKNSGLGMHMVKVAVDKLKGEIKLSSKTNQGSTFEVILPGH